MAPTCPSASAAKPMAKGKTVPPKRPMIIRPEISFFSSGEESSACAKMMEKTLELPKPTKAMPT